MSFAFAEIKLTNLEKNVANIRKEIGNGVRILAVVKANAYGHGSVEISKKLTSLNVNDLAVATYEEAIEIQSAGIKANILILGSITNEEIISSISRDIVFTIYDISQLHFINSLKNINNIPFHLKIDTGMNRLGIEIKEIPESINIIKKNKNLFLKGIYTHFPESNLKTSSFTKLQIMEFNKIITDYKNAIPGIDFFHIANSSGIFNYKDSHLNMIRPGLALYGLYSDDDNFYPIMELKTSLIKIRNIKEGDSISYGRTFTAKGNMKIGVIPIGYADGLPRALSNKGKVICNNVECPILGRVCMDLTIVDISNVRNPKVGDNVTIFGNDKISANEVAEICETIPYEIICGISKRVKRIYK